MSVPYAKNMAVEFADKTTKGINIDGKFDSTDSAMELLQQAIDGKIGFDGYVNMRYNGQNLYVNKSEISEYNDGVYKASNSFIGIVILSSGGPTRIVTYVSSAGHIYYGSGSDDIIILAESKIGTKLYKHDVIIKIDDISYPTDGEVTLSVITDKKEPFTGLHNFLLNFLLDPEVTTYSAGGSELDAYHKVWQRSTKIQIGINQTYPNFTALDEHYLQRNILNLGSPNSYKAIKGAGPWALSDVSFSVNADLTTGDVSQTFTTSNNRNISFVSDTVTLL